MLLRLIIRSSTLLVVLGVGLQAPALNGARWEGPESAENQQERHGDRQEPQGDKQERRDERHQPRVDRQERRDDRGNRSDHGDHGDHPMRQQEKQERRVGRQEQREGPRDHPGQRRETPMNERPSRSRDQARAWQHNRGWRGEDAWTPHPTWKEHRAHAWESEHRDWAHRGGYGGYIIPEPQFRVRFGPERWFRIQTRPMIYMGYPRFRYGNYWFLIVDPWPEFWSDNWYADDDVYIDYNDGYYLHNRRQPGVSIAVSVSL